MKVHLRCEYEPILREGSEIEADCGAIVKNSVFAMKFDGTMGQIAEFNPLMVCAKCMSLELGNNKRFIYGIVSGPESSSEGTSASQPSPSVGEAG